MQAHSLFLILCAIVTGAAVPFQAGANAALGRTLGHPLWATLMSLAISMACVLPLLLIARVELPTLSNLSHAPRWIWIGGVVGAFYVTGAILVAPRLGAAGFVTAVIAGQMIASVAIDHGGLISFPQRTMTLQRLAGLLLIFGGLVVMQAQTFSSRTGLE
ncbi:DMT family transporter [Aureimonas sp. AU40]|uniref:DMT family transporter n=1 Tax=Aureimonas sp. AU40 TaxID=1637747 RepID=UPI000784F381|nr:DMT family transporter [Aureimonas sp. AU40]